ncbi:hypothetical protein [Rhizobium phage RHph_N46]|nr:hypothetical protein EVC12_007 [Rhizobium phage RHph_I42]QXV73692.1 hypothetical protein [Rhizobium phage RHph_N46]
MTYEEEKKAATKKRVAAGKILEKASVKYTAAKKAFDEALDAENKLSARGPKNDG